MRMAIMWAAITIAEAIHPGTWSKNLTPSAVILFCLVWLAASLADFKELANLFKRIK